MKLSALAFAAAALLAAHTSHASVVTHGQPVYMTQTLLYGMTGVNPAENMTRTTTLDTTPGNVDWSTSGGYLANDVFHYDFSENQFTITLNPAGAAWVGTNVATMVWFQIHLSDPTVAFSGLSEVGDQFTGALGGTDGFVTAPANYLMPDGSLRWSNISFTLMLDGSALTAAVREAGTAFTATYEFGLTSLAPTTPTTPTTPSTPNDVPEPASLALVGAALAGLAASRRRSRA